MKTVYHIYEDSGHAWLKVEREELNKLGILEQITSYSYQKGTAVFLEEDADLTTFAKAKLEQDGVKITYREHFAQYSRIRSYDCYAPNKRKVTVTMMMPYYMIHDAETQQFLGGIAIGNDPERNHKRLVKALNHLTATCINKESWAFELP